MERIGAFSAGRTVLADMDHFLYLKRRTVGVHTAYLMCRQSTCPCTLKWQQIENTIVFNRPHNHAPVEVDYQELLFRQTLRHRASVESTPIRTIFRQEQQNNPVGSQRIKFSEIAKLMQRARQAKTPPVPTSIEHFSRLITDQRWSRRYGYDFGPNENEFFRTFLECKLNPIVIFVSESILRYVATLEECHIHLDATLEIVPKNGIGTQLFIIHLHAFNTVFPLLLAFMHMKSEEGYLRVLQYMQRIVALEPTVVMADYEDALRNAVGKVWPNVRLLGCWFHYARDVFQKSRLLGLQGNNKQEELTKVSMVLPLLPDNQIQEGIKYLEIEGIDSQFLNYLRERWEGRDISVYGMDQRPNNGVESFHRDLFTRIGRPLPNIWALLDILRFVEHKKVCDIQSLMAGRVLPSRNRPRYLRGIKLLNKCQKQLTKDNDVPKYLKSVCRLSDRLVRLFGPVEDIATQRSSNSSLSPSFSTSVDEDIAKWQNIETVSSAAVKQKSEYQGRISLPNLDDHLGNISNSEDAHSLITKQENLLDGKMNIEFENIIIKSEDETTYEGDQEDRDQASPVQDSVISDSPSSETIKDTNMKKNKSSESDALSYNRKSHNFGTVKVKTSLFKKPNEQMRIHNKKLNLSTDSSTEIESCRGTTDNHNNRTSEISMNMNITTQKHNHVKNSPNEKTCSDSTEKQLTNQQTIHKILAFKEVPINTEIIYLNNNKISFRKRECSGGSGINSSISQQLKVSRDNQTVLPVGNKLGILILKNVENSQPSVKDCGLSSSSDAISLSDRCTEHVDDLARDKSNSQELDTKNSNEESMRRTSDKEQEETNKYVFVTIKPFEKPKDIAEGSKIIMEIDREMEKLINLRQSLMVDLVKDKSLLPSKRKNQNECERLSKRK